MKKIILLISILLPVLLFSQGTGGYCLDYDGDDWVQVADDNSLDDTSTLTIEFWVYPTTLDNDPRGVVSKREDFDSNNSYGIFFYTDDHLFIDLDSENDRIEISNPFEVDGEFDVNKWYYVAVVYDGSLSEVSRVKVYVAEDDVESVTLVATTSESSTSIPNGISDLYIGKLNQDGNATYGCFDGLIDELRIWNTARTETQIEDNMYQQISGTTSGLVAYWKFDENTGQTTYDAAGSNDGQLGSISGVDSNDPSWNTSDAPLPVTLSTFSAFYTNDLVTINWSTEMEENNLGWNIYRGLSETAIQHDQEIKVNTTLIPGAGTTNELTEYQYVDHNPVTQGITYWYWLESIDLDGSTEIHSPTNVTIPNNSSPSLPNQYGLYQNYPNPFNPTTTIEFAIEQDEEVELQIFNIKGKFIKSIYKDFTRADTKVTLTWDGTDKFNRKVSSGIYYSRLITDKKDYLRKMVLMK